MPLLKKKQDVPAQTAVVEPGDGGEKKKKSLSEIQIPNWLAAVLIVGLLLIIVLVFWLNNRGSAGQNGTSFASEPSSDATEVQVLPQRVRSYGSGSVDNPFVSDAIGKVELTGIVTNSAGKSTVILQSDQASYIVSVGDSLPDSQWVVSEVGENYVKLKLDENEKTIWLSGASKSDAASSVVTNSESTSGGASDENK